MLLLYQVFTSVIILVGVPFFTGIATCKILSIRKSIASFYLVGTFVEWAFFQLITVPCAIFRCNFWVVVILLTAILGILCFFGIVVIIKERKEIHFNIRPVQFSTIIAFVLMLGIYCFTAYSLFTLQYISLDDSRFVVNAVDIVRTNRMFLTNPSTGAAISGFWGDMHRDVISPWAVYFAYISKITKIPVAVVAHTVLPQTLLLCMGCAYWLIAEAFFNDDCFAKCSVVFIVFLIIVFGVRKGYDIEAFIVTTLWQGKAVVGALGIPTMFLCGAWIYHDSDKWGNYIFLYIVAFAMCLMSGMGIIISGLMAGIVGIAFGLLKKKISITIKYWIGALIPFAYYVVSLLKY